MGIHNNGRHRSDPPKMFPRIRGAGLRQRKHISAARAVPPHAANEQPNRKAAGALIGLARYLSMRQKLRYGTFQATSRDAPPAPSYGAGKPPFGFHTIAVINLFVTGDGLNELAAANVAIARVPPTPRNPIAVATF